MSVTLADAERELALRCGPYDRETITTGGTASFTVQALQSLVQIDEITDTYILRRGVMSSNGAAIAGFNTDDQVRLVKQFDPETGTVEVDRNYNGAPVVGEDVEFHHLHPTRELRVATLAGIQRCYLVDRVTVTTSAIAVERDITASAAWINQSGQILEVEWQYPNTQWYIPRATLWWQEKVIAGHIWLAIWPDPYPQNLLITARRPADSWINGADSTTGPTVDSDVLPITLDYAAAAAHVEAWRRFPSRLAPAAATGMQMNQQMAAAEFTRMTRKYYNPPPKRILLSKPIGRPGVQRP